MSWFALQKKGGLDIGETVHVFYNTRFCKAQIVRMTPEMPIDELAGGI